MSKPKKKKPAKKAPRKPRVRKVPCTNCKEPTDAEQYFCHGCKHVICFDCDLPNDLGDFPMGPHERHDHILSARRRRA